MSQCIDGKAAAALILAEVRAAAKALLAHNGRQPGLAVIIVGDDQASHVYVRSKGRLAKECGFRSVQHKLPTETSQEDLAALVTELNADDNINGILLQLPLPQHLDAQAIIHLIAPEKDVDGLNVVNAGKLAIGDINTGLLPCTPAGAMILVQQVRGSDLSGLTAVVIGRSNLFGKPMAQLLLNANATVTIAHSKSPDVAAACRNADIVVVAVGRPRMVKADWIKVGATVIDVGINRLHVDADSKGRLVGDCDFEQLSEFAGAITPVPGGVGPMTLAMLMANTVIAAFQAAHLPRPHF